MSYVRFFPRDARVMMQRYDDYGEKADKPEQVADFSLLTQKIASDARGEGWPEMLAEAVADVSNRAYTEGTRAKSEEYSG